MSLESVERGCLVTAYKRCCTTSWKLSNYYCIMFRVHSHTTHTHAHIHMHTYTHTHIHTHTQICYVVKAFNNGLSREMTKDRGGVPLEEE